MKNTNCIRSVDLSFEESQAFLKNLFQNFIAKAHNRVIRASTQEYGSSILLKCFTIPKYIFS